ncbi:SipW-dependent-type signal peptide-containing protein [Candidatus Shapirobacteria bacterium]|nr:SipW-dependent-type signal peptide-containing protein [Candidatus Shapirobacteria bacterium]
MTKRIIISLAMIALTIAGVTSATVAYFSDTVVKHGNTFAMGTVKVTQAEGRGLPYTFTNLIPGQQRDSGKITVQNTGSMPIDLYIGQQETSNPDGIGPKLIGNVEYTIYEVYCGTGEFKQTWVGWQDILSLYTRWQKVGDDIPAGEQRCYKFSVIPSKDMGDTFQGKGVTNAVIIYGVQYDSPTPTTPVPKDYSL